MFDIKDKVAIVTGGASGIGLATVEMILAKGGAVVNISSVSGLRGQAYEIVYNTTKFAVRGMTKALALEFAPHCIRVNSVHPACVLSGMVNADVVDGGWTAK